jgi:hypothetical protein
MSQEKQFKELGRKAYLSYHQDGLIDILIGLGILGFGLMMLTDSVVFNMLAWMPIIFYVPLKNRITVPRFGYVQFSSERSKHLRLLGILLLGLLVLMVFAGLYVFTVSGDMPPAIEAALGKDRMLLMGGLFAFMLVLAGLVTRLDRLFVYAALTVLIIPGGVVLGIEAPYRVIFLGTLILIIGIVLLIRFVRRYPLEPEKSS